MKESAGSWPIVKKVLFWFVFSSITLDYLFVIHLLGPLKEQQFLSWAWATNFFMSAGWKFRFLNHGYVFVLVVIGFYLSLDRAFKKTTILEGKLTIWLLMLFWGSLDLFVLVALFGTSCITFGKIVD